VTTATTTHSTVTNHHTSDQGHSADLRLGSRSGIAVGGLSVLMVAMYFIYSGPPPQWNVLTRGLLTLITLAVLTVFAVAVSRLLPTRQGRVTVSGQVSVVSLFLYIGVILFSTSLEVGTPLAYPNKEMDPTTDGPLAAAMALAHGPIAHLWIAMFLTGFAAAIGRHGSPRIVPAWTVRGSIIVAAINILAVPSLYFGMDATNFYAVNGWGADALVGLITLVWIGLIGLGIRRVDHSQP
jgi:hypothetical protein